MLEQFAEIADRQLAIAEDAEEETWSDDVSAVDGDDGRPAVCMPEGVVTASNADDLESGFGEGLDAFSTGKARSAAHAAIVMR